VKQNTGILVPYGVDKQEYPLPLFNHSIVKNISR